MIPGGSPALHVLPISRRPPPSWGQRVKGLLFGIVFNFGCLMINGSHFVFLFSLRLVPLAYTRRLYHRSIKYTKGAFGCLLILMCQWFAPTTLQITFEREGLGKFADDEIEQIAVKDDHGNIISLNLPTKFVLIANHQIYTDWLYAWCLLYYIGDGVHRCIFITLKKSLKWVPIVGWAMQFFMFIFLARSWASDRVHLSKSLAALGDEAEKEDQPFCFVLYPEGTLVSENTRPISKKFADKIGVEDMKHILLPRSTGLHYSLRSLAPHIPELHLLDMTMLYPGVPPMGYGQTYYTLRSIFFEGVPPPIIHIHLRKFAVATDVPIGKTSGSSSYVKDPQRAKAAVDIPEDQKQIFDEWLRQLWKEKDEWIDESFERKAASQGQIEIPLKLRRKRDILDAFCFLLPAAAAYVAGKLRR